MQDRMKAEIDRAASAAKLDNTMVVVVAALSAGALYAIIAASPVLPELEPNIFLSMSLAP